MTTKHNVGFWIGYQTEKRIVIILLGMLSTFEYRLLIIIILAL